MITSSTVREALKAEIAAKIRSGEPQNWKAVRDKYPDISLATFWRYVKAARAASPDRETAAAARRQLSTDVNGRLTEVADVADESTRAPMPLRDLNLTSRMILLFDDIALLRDYAMNNGAVTHPHFFAQAIGLTDRALQTSLRIAEAQNEAQMQADFFDAIIEEVAAEDPAVAHRIIVRLRRLNQLSQ